MRIVILLFIGSLSYFSYCTAQTCCSGGVPVSSNLGLPAGEAHLLQLNLSYDLNVLRTLKSGSQILDDRSRDRRTHSILFEMGYSFSDQFSIDGFFSFVRQERTVRQFGNENFTYSQGIGDAVVLFKHRIFSFDESQTNLYGAIGVKAPLGASDLTDNESGILLNADLQPGSGAWDGLLWTQYNTTFTWRPSLSFVATSTYSFKGKNNSYLGSQIYQFGNEFQLSAGISDRIFIANQLIDPALLMRFRTVEADQNNGADLPSTGGEWLFINPSLSIWLTPDLSINVNGEMPIYSRLEGTQATPTYRINTGIFYKIGMRNK